jgi:antitoxin (DNA-binding transcriptional repressor) of toxin-antitoxin stability system
VERQIIHVSDAEAANDFAALLERVREGAEVVIEHDARPVAVVRPADVARGQLQQSEALGQANAEGNELGFERAMDDESGSNGASSKARLKILKAARFPAANKMERVEQSLDALRQPLEINLSATEWATVAALREEDEE